MSCNGCRVLRKGCSESCILRPCLQWIDSPEAQGHATVFVAKFFGRAGLMSFISAVPETQRPSLFQSLLFEAAGRTVNPVNGAVGLLWTGNWHVCQASVETVLRGGTLQPIPEFFTGNPTPIELSSAVTTGIASNIEGLHFSRSKLQKRRRSAETSTTNFSSTDFLQVQDLDLSLTRGSPAKGLPEKRRPRSPSMYSEDSVTTTTCLDSNTAFGYGEPQLLNLFN